MFVTHSRGLLFHSFSTHLAFSQVWLTFLGLSFLFSFFGDPPGLLSLPSVFTHLSWLTSWIANWLEAHSLCSFGWAFWKPHTNNKPELILLPNLRSLSSMFTLDSKPIANPTHPGISCRSWFSFFKIHFKWEWILQLPKTLVHVWTSVHYNPLQLQSQTSMIVCYDAQNSHGNNTMAVQ